MNLPSQLRRLPSLLAALSCWWMALTLYRAWQTPLDIDGGRWVSLGVGIMAMEFVLVHSGAMLSGLAKSQESAKVHILIFSAAYALFGIAIAVAFKSTLLFWSFAGIMVSRWMGFITDTDAVREKLILRSALNVLLYMGVVVISVFVNVPPGGLTTEILDKVYPHRGTGIWETRPQQALAAGMIYFAILGLFELRGGFRPAPNPDTATAAVAKPG